MSVLDGVRTGGDTQRAELFVEILRWPAEAGRRGVALDAGHPCLWLLGHGELPPEIGPDEDWVRVPASEHDVQEKVRRLAECSTLGGALEPGAVVVDDDGLLHYAGHRVVVPPIEASILNRLGEHPERVVTRGELVDLVWNDDHRSARALDSRVHTLRGRVAPLRLTIHTIRGHGFLLAAEPTSSNEPALEQAPARSNPWSNS